MNDHKPINKRERIMNRKIIFVAFTILFSLSIMNAGDVARIGTTSGTQLLPWEP
jgi:hypothetical protein